MKEGSKDEKLRQKYNNIKSELQKTQQSKIEQMKDLMVLEAKLKTAQEEALKADSEKHNLQRELKELRQA